MSWISRRRTGRRFDRRFRQIVEGALAAELCPGSGQPVFWASGPRGECPTCKQPVSLDTHPDGGPGAVAAPHERTE